MTDGVELPRVVDGGTLTTVVVVGGGVVVLVVVAAVVVVVIVVVVVGVVVVVVGRFVVTVVERFVAVLTNSVVVEEDSGTWVLSVDSCSDIPRSTPAGCGPASSAPIAMVFRCASTRFVYKCRLTPINPCSFRWFHCQLCGFWRYTWEVWFVGVRAFN